MRTLFFPFLRAMRNRFLPGGRPAPRTLILAGLGLTIWLVLYMVSARVLRYFHSQNELGVILSLKLFEMAWTILFAMLVFSSMIAGISSLYLSRDNEILCSAPISTKHLFRMRYLATILVTGWMMLIFSFPVFASFGTVFHSGPAYWPLLALSLLATVFTAGSLGLLLTILSVSLFPARRTKDIITYLSLLFGVLLFLVIRLLRPEDLANPEKFPDFLEYLSAMQTPAAPLLPSNWPTRLLAGQLRDGSIDMLLLGLELLTPLVLFFAGELAMQRHFFAGFSKAQESFGGQHRFRAPRYRADVRRWFFRRELRMFLRDSNEWSQLFLIGALVIIYLYNFKVLPLDRSPLPIEYIRNLIGYANIGLTGFLIASLAARFVYPAIGWEGEGFALLRSAPLTLGRYLWYKYLFYVIPFTGLALLLLAASNHLLRVSGPMQWISLSWGLIITWTVVAMALGFGAIHADFRAESRTSVLGSFGAISFLFCAMGLEVLLIGLGAVPAYRLTRMVLSATPPDWQALATSLVILLVVVFLAGVTGLFTVKKGIAALEQGAGSYTLRSRNSCRAKEGNNENFVTDSGRE